MSKSNKTEQDSYIEEDDLDLSMGSDPLNSEDYDDFRDEIDDMEAFENKVYDKIQSENI